MIDVILLALDGSKLAEATLPYAVAIQRAFSSRLILLTVVNDGETADDSVEWRLRQAEARSYLTGMAEELGEQGIEADTVVTAGKPSEAILEVARERDADLVLLSSHGSGGPSPFEVGGTAHKILSAGATSVLLVRTAQGARATGGPERGTILVPVDGSRRSEWALCLAVSVARASGSDLLLLRVLPDPHQMLSGAGETEVDQLLETSRKCAEDWLAGRVRQLTAPDLKLRTRVIVAASVPRAIDEVAVQENVSLTVLSAHGGAADDGWPYGSVSGALLHYGTTPVLVFQDAPSRATDDERPNGSRRKAPHPDLPAWTH